MARRRQGDRGFRSGLGVAICVTVFAWLCLWLLSRLINDRVYAAQFVYWIPAPVACGAGAVGIVTGRVLCGSRAKRQRRMNAALMAISLGVVGYTWHVERLVFPPRASAGSPSMTVLAWNPATDYFDEFAKKVVAAKPDLVCIANRPGRTRWDLIREQVGGAQSTVRFSNLSLVSRYRVIRWGGTNLGIRGSRPRLSVWTGGSSVTTDSGEAMFAELDTRALLGRTIVVWVVDFPSEPRIFRQRACSEAHETLAAFSGPGYRRNEDNLDVAEEPGFAGFPAADMIVGDFNTPRGSDSLRRVAGDLHHAHDDAGCGPDYSWPRELPIVAIDQAFIAPWLRATQYGAVDLGGGRHLAQVFTVEPAEVAPVKGSGR